MLALQESDALDLPRDPDDKENTSYNTEEETVSFEKLDKYHFCPEHLV